MWRGQGSEGRGVQKAVDFVQQFRIARLHGVIGDKMGGDRRLVHRVDRGHAADGVHPRAQPSQVRRDPMGRHPAVGIGRQQGAALAHQRCGGIHGKTPRRAGIGLGTLQLALENMDGGRRSFRHGARNGDGPVCRVIDQQDDVVGRFALREKSG